MISQLQQVPHATSPASIMNRMPSTQVKEVAPKGSFDYDMAFGRNLGIFTPAEQQKLRNSTVALAGLGGVGGVYAHALARLGVGHFVLADGDTFEVANFNRQMAGNMTSVGVNKARAVERQIHEINPEAKVTVWEQHLDETNIDAFLDGVDLVVDGIEMFVIDAHRLLMRKARERNLYLTMAAPLGFSAAVIVFAPDGMEPDEYFDWHEGQSYMEQIALFALGLAPAGLHFKDVDLNYLDLKQRTGPSNIGACLLCAGVVVTEAARVLLNRKGGWCAPGYLQFDSYGYRLIRGRLARGNRSLLQRVKKYFLLRKVAKLESDKLKRASA